MTGPLVVGTLALTYITLSVVVIRLFVVVVGAASEV